MEPIASVPFTDGISRTVFLDVDGRQFVLDDEGNRVHGVWLIEPDPEPQFVSREPAR